MHKMPFFRTDALSSQHRGCLAKIPSASSVVGGRMMPSARGHPLRRAHPVCAHGGAHVPRQPSPPERSALFLALLLIARCASRGQYKASTESVDEERGTKFNTLELRTNAVYGEPDSPKSQSHDGYSNTEDSPSPKERHQPGHCR
jgi:hypothetical protein